MHPFWNATVKLFPRWVAPNLLTLLGFLFLVSQTILLWVIDPDYKKGGEINEIPKWVSTKFPLRKNLPLFRLGYIRHLPILWLIPWTELMVNKHVVLGHPLRLVKCLIMV